MSEQKTKAGNRFLTVKEVSAYLRLSDATIYRLAKDGELPAAKVGGKWLFKKSFIDEWYLRQTKAVRDETVSPADHEEERAND